MEQHAGLRGDSLLALIHDGQALDDLQHYFGVGKYHHQEPFHGAWFERLAGGGDRSQTLNRITADDLVAVGALSVKVPTPVAVRLLDGELGDRMAALLSQIPAGIDLVDDAAEDAVKDGSPAHQAWQFLTGQDGVEWVTAGKVMARKRPRLLPVYDSVVKCVLGWGGPFWVPLRTELRAHDKRLHHGLEALKNEAGLPSTIGALRMLDVVLWMRHRAQHTAKCPGPNLAAAGALPAD